MLDADVNLLPDDALVVRGGMNLPENFTQGSGVLADSAGLLHDVSVQCAETASRLFTPTVRNPNRVK